MATAEEIAREAAEALVTAEPFTNSAGGTDWRALIGPLQILTTFTPEASDAFLGHLRQTVATAFLAAIERALREVPVPGGLSEARLKAIDEWLDDKAAREDVELFSETVLTTIRALCDHVRHLARALHDCGQDGSAAVWAAGYEAGKEAGEKRCQEIFASLSAWERDNVTDLLAAKGEERGEEAQA